MGLFQLGPPMEFEELEELEHQHHGERKRVSVENRILQLKLEFCRVMSKRMEGAFQGRMIPTKWTGPPLIISTQNRRPMGA